MRVDSPRPFLLARIGSVNQSLLTTTDPTLFSDAFRSRARQLRVVAGRIDEG